MSGIQQLSLMNQQSPVTQQQVTSAAPDQGTQDAPKQPSQRYSTVDIPPPLNLTELEHHVSMVLQPSKDHRLSTVSLPPMTVQMTEGVERRMSTISQPEFNHPIGVQQMNSSQLDLGLANKVVHQVEGGGAEVQHDGQQVHVIRRESLQNQVRLDFRKVGL